MHIDVFVGEWIEEGRIRRGSHGSTGVRCSFYVSAVCDYRSKVVYYMDWL